MAVILIADDHAQIRSILEEYSKKEGFTTLLAGDGHEALRLFHQHRPDVVLLDVMMPGVDGFYVCREIRRVSDTPVIMVTARGEDFEKIMGLDIGADDYIVKPFSPPEVMARVRSLLRRIAKSDSASRQVLTHGSLSIDLDHYSVTLAGQAVPLTKKELEILWTLAGEPNRVFSRDSLLSQLWGYDYFGDSRTVDSHIKRLRSKLEAAPHPHWDIKTVWGVGYKFEVKQDAQ
ncbi:MAG: response regulator transcription factor [Clostridiales bacterium]|nr:response regulator transcription factor [Clostridiales bacterium]